MVALLLIYPTLSAVRLVGTDLVQAVPLVLAAAIGHVVTEGVTWAVLIPLVLGGTPGHLPRRPDGGLGLAVGDPPRHRHRADAHRAEDARRPARSGSGIIGAGLLLLGPLAWGFLRQRRGLPAFDNNAAAWRVPD